MRYCWLILMLWANVAFGATVTVRAGEHDTFTRFVVATDQPVDFSYGQTADEITLQLPGLTTALLGQAFERVGRSRIRSIATTGEALSFAKSCDCEALVYRIGESLIVIDVYDDAPSQPVALIESARVGAVPTQNEAPEAPTLPLFGVARSPLGFEDIAERSSAGAAETSGDAGPNATASLSLLEQHLAREVGLALTQGTLMADPTLRLDVPVVLDPIANPDPQDEPEILRSSIPNLRTSGVMRVREATQELDNSFFPTLPCLNAAEYDVAGWAPEESFDEAISEYRRQLVLEFDRIDSEMALQLARTYAFFGFGAEAIAIVKLVDGDETAFKAVEEIAQVLEYASSDGQLVAQASLECGGPLAFWSAMSFETIPKDIVFDVDAAVRELNRLPKHLRSVLAPELSKRLRERGHTSQSSLILRGAERSDGELTGQAVLEASALSDVSGAPQASARDLLDVVDAGAVEAPLALISFINRQVAEGEEISPEIALLAESFALQFRGTEIETDLVAGHMLALAKSGQFDAAFSLFMETEFDQDSYQDAIASLFQTLTDDADDVTFLKYASLQAYDRHQRLDEDVLLEMADRSLRAGFPRIARKLLGSVVQRASTDGYLRLEADLLLAEGDSERALGLLARLPDQNETRTAAAAHFTAQNYAAAAEIYGALGDDAQQFEAAFRSQDVALDSLERAEPVESLRRLQAEETVQDIPTDILEINALLGVSKRVRQDTDTILKATKF